MIRLGLKLTHDGGLAVLDDGALVVSHEAEKSANLARHAPLDAIDIQETLSLYGLSLGDVDRVVVDGWIDAQATTGGANGARAVSVAPYHENETHRDPLAPFALEGIDVGGRPTAYTSYMHATGHAIGTYATSPWAASQLDALILVWDGPMLPRLYRFRAAEGELTPLRPLFGLVGHVHPVFGSYFGPFVPSSNGARPSHSGLSEEALLGLSGKIMAWAGLGTVDDGLIEVFADAYTQTANLRWDSIFTFTRHVYEAAQRAGARDEDVVATFQAYLGEKLVASLRKALERDPSLPRRLCFTGGCALNIAWNSRLRASGLFEDIWVPPFPNDAGSALGAAAADRVAAGEAPAIAWDVYRGPPLVDSVPSAGWRAEPCDLRQLAALLHESGEPIVFLSGRAELGPRALGNRSILCSAVRPETKDLLNEMKLREPYRPVAPICLEERAAEVFDPGSPDPYMLFTHIVRAPWRERTPAIVHVDGTARLQTISARQNPAVAELLEHYRRLSGIPLLCNTSANLKGSGFFPDLRSATAWPAARQVWCDSVLYRHPAHGEAT